ncbi:MAG: amidohydrolase [Pyrinomonadaceae bacterium]
MRIAFLILALSISTAGQTAADLVLLNGNIRTLDKQRPRAEAVAVSKGRITAVGTTTKIRKFVGPNTRVLDAKGKLVIPGFNDSHVHFTGIGNQFSHMDLRGALGGGQIVEKIGFFTRFLPKGRWILGGGLTFADIGRFPTLEQIDAASPNNPMLLYSPDYRKALVNSAAMAMAGIRSATGLVEGNAVLRIRKNIPSGHERNWTEIVETASNYAASLGVTSIQDVHSDDLAAVLHDLAANGRLKTRVYECIGIGERRRSIAAKLTAASGDAMVRIGCIKGMSDGSAEEIAELRHGIGESDKAGLQVMIHAIGKTPIGHTIDAFEAVIAENGKRDRRFRIEHGPRMKPADFERLAKSGIVASMQPHLFDRGGSSFGDNYRGFIAAGVAVAFGSDASMTDLNPLYGIYAAVDSGPNSITVEEAVRAYTYGSAYAEFQEREKGTIEAGKLADFVILSEDIFVIDRSEISGTGVVMTIVGGSVVFETK